MEYRLLGRSGLKISTITMGTMTIGGGGNFAKVGNVGVEEARRYVDLCLDAGVNLIDTADIYSTGTCEEILGEVLGGKRKNGVLVATKARFSMGPGPNDGGLSRQHLISACEASLKRLKTDVIDLYQVHEWDGQTPLEETMEALDTLVRQGKVRYIGCSNYSAWHLMKALATSNERNYQRFVSQQIHYTLHSREAEFELIPAGLDQGVSVLVWSPLAGGWLSGKYTRSSKPSDGRQVRGFKEPPIYDPEHLWKIVDVVNEVAGARGVSGAQVSLAWLLSKQIVASVIIGGRNIGQFEDNLKAAELKLTAEELGKLDAVSQPNLPYPYWHQSFTAQDRLGEADLALHRPYLDK